MTTLILFFGDVGFWFFTTKKTVMVVGKVVMSIITSHKRTGDDATYWAPKTRRPAKFSSIKLWWLGTVFLSINMGLLLFRFFPEEVITIDNITHIALVLDVCTSLPKALQKDAGKFFRGPN